jgi:aldose 1-epimerase
MAATTGKTITIEDSGSGTRAEILPGVGFNLFSFRPVVEGVAVEVIWAEEGFGPASTLSLHGVPLLFPFAGRLQGDTFTFEGNEYRVTGSEVYGGNVAHGFVLSRPWRVVHAAADEAAGEFHASVDDPSLLEQWPADFRIQVTYRVQGASLISDIVIENPDTRPLPFGFGTHPYFRLPIGDGSRPDATITVPASEVWTHVDGLPTGERAPVTGSEDLREGVRFADLAFDGVLTGLAVEDGGLVHTRIADPVSGLTVDQSFDPVFRNAIIYTPVHGEAVAVEPWTTVPNAFALGDAGIETGLNVLAHGEKWATRITISLTSNEEA